MIMPNDMIERSPGPAGIIDAQLQYPIPQQRIQQLAADNAVKIGTEPF